MDITSATLQRFTTWLLGHGRGEDTAKVYRNHLRRSAADPKGVTNRLVSRDLSPNTRHTNKAALLAWAKFSKDSDLRDQVEEIRLPPARRVTPKIPLSVDAWQKLAKHLQTCKLRCEPLRHAMLIVVKRGLRCSDVLRIRRREIAKALESGVLGFEGKGRKRSEYRAHPIRAELEALAAIPGRWESVGDLVCDGGKRASQAHRLYRTLKAEAARVDIANSYPHQMRRTYATNFLRQLHGDPQAIIKLQKHMDWESMNTAAMYADAVDSNELDATAERMTDRLFG